MKQYFTFIDWKTQYGHDVKFFTTWSKDSMQFKSNPSNLFCSYWQTDSEVYMESQKTQNSQCNIEGNKN